jgi:Zinc carboxypeptidase
MRSARLLRAVIALGIVLSFVFPTSQASASQILSSYFVKTKSDAVMRQIAKKFDMEHRREGGFEVIVPKAKAKELLALAPDATLIEADIKNVFRRRDRQSPGWRDSYHSFAAVNQIMNTAVQNYPGMVSLQNYGTSTQGNPLTVLHLHTTVNTGTKPEILLTGCTHGNELITTELMLALLDRLTTTYATDSRIKAMVDNHEIYIIPVVNPDGFTQQDRYDNDVDPNRSYPYPGNEQNQPSGSIAPLMQFTQGHNFAGSLDFHSYGRLVMYPWAYTTDPVDSQLETRFEGIAQTMSQENGYTPGQISQILYSAPGSSADYYLWKKNTIAMAVEMTTEYAPADIQTAVNENMEPTLKFVEQF